MHERQTPPAHAWRDTRKERTTLDRSVAQQVEALIEPATRAGDVATLADVQAVITTALATAARHDVTATAAATIVGVVERFPDVARLEALVSALAAQLDILTEYVLILRAQNGGAAPEARD